MTSQLTGTHTSPTPILHSSWAVIARHPEIPASPSPRDRRSTKCDATPRGAPHVAVRLSPRLLLILLLPRARAREGGVAVPAQGGRHVTSRHASPPPRLAFLDPSAASPLLRLPPALPSMSRLGSFLSLPPPPLPLVLFPPPPESGSAPTCRPPPRSLSRPRFLYPAGGVGTVAFCGLLGSTKKRERKKNELSICGRRLACRSLAHSSGSSASSWCVAKRDCGTRASRFGSFSDHFEVRSFVEL